MLQEVSAHVSDACHKEIQHLGVGQEERIVNHVECFAKAAEIYYE